MASPGEKWGLCGHSMAGFDFHAYYARCRDKGKGDDPCVNLVGTWSASQKRSGFRCFVGITYSATF